MSRKTVVVLAALVLVGGAVAWGGGRALWRQLAAMHGPR